ncbi:GntR family transcriptional regulator [Pseudonocardia sp. T1-2H]|uniref:GntR family transcriptional regulator n=1 Tax=Pseudonocardia sp. T1-2H TaxID=3128899 RepID=UPI00405420DA
MPTGQYERRWQVIAADLRAKIQAGRWQPGDRLPPMSQLQEEYDAAKGTVRFAINALRDEGLVTPRTGSGIYVNG